MSLSKNDETLPTERPATDDKSPVQSGQMYVLHENPDPEWLSSATSLPLIDFGLPPTVMIHGTRKTTMLGIPRTQKFSMNGLIVRRDSATLELLTASDALPAAATAELIDTYSWLIGNDLKADLP